MELEKNTTEETTGQDAETAGSVSHTPRKQIALPEWLAEGESHFGADRDTWRFKCTFCGHVSSAAEARHRNPQVDDGRPPEWLRNYLGANCEGRLGGPGCDWSLYGLFQIHQLEVVVDGSAHPVFVFAPSEPEPTP